MQITKCLSHPHIVRLHETVRSQRSLCLILDLCLGGDLHQWISQRFRKDKDKGPGQYRTPRRSEVATFVWQMLTAVAYLHHHKIAHRDIKPGNLLLEDPSAPMTLKLADFNLACNFRKGQKLSSRCGSLMYLAPEVIHKSYTERCDIWSIGVTFQDLVTGEALWQAQEEPQIEKMLDWMYEQSAASVKPDEDTLMNMPINAQKDQDIEDVKNLQNSTAGSLFLGSATKTTEDMVRKLREDPLFQIRRQEHAARESMMTNPLIMAKIQKKREKEAKKAVKKEKKAAKKEEKALKKAAKAAKKAKDSSSDSEPEPPRAAAREAPPKRPREEEPDLSALGPSSVVVSKRMEHDERVAKQKEQALASRGLGRRLTEEEKERRVEQMRVDAKKHEKMKDQRIASTEEREKQIEELEAKMRDKSDQKYFRDLRKDAYAGDTKEMTMADRLQTQRHRRQKHLNDPLERD
ncbi:CPK1 [Symbiodinium sp. KB8]|nr:CPK1 [Symbiodinium sp. KB8]